MTSDGRTELGSSHRVGVPFGRYSIQRRLGRGGMAEVFLADQLGPLGPVRPVALKRLLPNLAHDEGTRRLFLEEMEIAAQLNHPNIATTYDFGVVDGVYFLALEYVEGLALNRVIERIGPLSIPAALHIVSAVADALAHAHTQQRRGRTTPVVHQDVSPHNIMLSVGGTVKLLDFGIARAEAAVLGGRVRGKLAYAAPEQLRGAAPDRRFDLWSLGVVLYEMLTATRPFPANDPIETLKASEERSYQPLVELRPETEPLSDLVWRALEPDPDRRWLAAEAFASACRRAAERFERFTAVDLVQLVELAGGSDSAKDLSEISATGVAALDPSGGLTYDRRDTITVSTPVESAHEVEPIISEDPAVGTGRRRRLAGAIVVLGALLVALFFVFGQRTPHPAEPRAAAGQAPVPTSEGTTSEAPPEPAIDTTAKEADVPEVPREAVRARSTRGARRGTRKPMRSTTTAAKQPDPVTTEAPQPAPEKTPATGLGVLSVRTTPWSKVKLDGRPLGEGIIAAKPVSSGPHTLTLTPGSTDQFAPLTVKIDIRPGLATKVFADFATGEVRVEPR